MPPRLTTRGRLALLAAVPVAAALLAPPALGVQVDALHGTRATPRVHPKVSVAGDIACGTNIRDYNDGDGTATQCRQRYTSALILDSDAVWTLGDHVYPTAYMKQLKAVYTPTWGRMKSVTYPSPGDHDYRKIGAKEYYKYFDRPRYYAFSTAGWRVFSLNSEINHSARSPQARWLKRKLSRTKADCIAAYWSTPRWTSGKKAPGDASFAPFWRALYAARADLVLAGDTHNYERFALQRPSGHRARNGMRQFVVGAGGRNLDGFEHILRNSQVRKKAFGVLQLRLYKHSYRWRFVDESRRTLDSGSTRCHRGVRR